jgi:hypothetical protein
MALRIINPPCPRCSAGVGTAGWEFLKTGLSWFFSGFKFLTGFN